MRREMEEDPHAGLAQILSGSPRYFLHPSQHRHRQSSVPKADVMEFSISLRLQAARRLEFPLMQRMLNPWQLSVSQF